MQPVDMCTDFSDESMDAILAFNRWGMLSAKCKTLTHWSQYNCIIGIYNNRKIFFHLLIDKEN